ncbi:MAG: hypothetical protein IT318_24725 [Anaerolineales bacterium]|nr:hypothetical protein [Anaerolineales bacterium]
MKRQRWYFVWPVLINAAVLGAAIVLLLAVRNDPSAATLNAVLSIVVGGASASLFQSISQLRDRADRREEARMAVIRELRLERQAAIRSLLGDVTRELLLLGRRLGHILITQQDAEKTTAAIKQVMADQLALDFTNATTGIAELAGILDANVLKELKAYIAMADGLSQYYATVCIDYLNTGKLPSADEFLRKSDPEAIAAHEHLGLLYRALDRFAIEPSDEF